MWRFLVLLAAGAAAFGTVYGLTRSAHRPIRQAIDQPNEQPPSPPGMVWIRGGEFAMGTDSELGWSDEKPAHRVRVDGFWIDEAEVTNAEFATFVEATGYVTTAEKPIDLETL